MKNIFIIIAFSLLFVGCAATKPIQVPSEQIVRHIQTITEFLVRDVSVEDIDNPGTFIFVKDTLILTNSYNYNTGKSRYKVTHK